MGLRAGPSARHRNSDPHITWCVLRAPRGARRRREPAAPSMSTRCRIPSGRCRPLARASRTPRHALTRDGGDGDPRRTPQREPELRPSCATIRANQFLWAFRAIRPGRPGSRIFCCVRRTSRMVGSVGAGRIGSSLSKRAAGSMRTRRRAPAVPTGSESFSLSVPSENLRRHCSRNHCAPPQGARAPDESRRARGPHRFQYEAILLEPPDRCLRKQLECEPQHQAIARRRRSTSQRDGGRPTNESLNRLHGSSSWPTPWCNQPFVTSTCAPSA